MILDRLDLSRFGFDFADDQLAMREAAESFARARVAPGAVERDRTRQYPLELVEEQYLDHARLVEMIRAGDQEGAAGEAGSYQKSCH